MPQPHRDAASERRIRVQRCVTDGDDATDDRAVVRGQPAAPILDARHRRDVTDRLPRSDPWCRVRHGVQERIEVVGLAQCGSVRIVDRQRHRQRERVVVRTEREHGCVVEGDRGWNPARRCRTPRSHPVVPSEIEEPAVLPLVDRCAEPGSRNQSGNAERRPLASTTRSAATLAPERRSTPVTTATAPAVDTCKPATVSPTSSVIPGSRPTILRSSASATRRRLNSMLSPSSLPAPNTMGTSWTPRARSVWSTSGASSTSTRRARPSIACD